MFQQRAWMAVGSACAAWLMGCSGDVRVTELGGAASGSTTSAPEPTTTGTGGAGAGGSDAGQGGEGGALACPSSWAHVLGGPGSQWPRSVAVGADGVVVTTIQAYADVVDIDGSPFADVSADGFVLAKLDASGGVLWTRTFGGGNVDEQLLPIAIDAHGDILVAGSFVLALDLGGGVAATAPGTAMFVAKVSSAGTPLWLSAFPGDYYGYGLAGLGVDAEGGVVFAGALSGKTLQFGGETLSGELVLAKLDTHGAPLWAHVYDGVMLEVGTMLVMGDGRVVVAGSLEGTTDFGGGALTTAGGYDAFVATLDGDGHHLWSRRFGDENLQRVSAVAADQAGNVFLAGTNSGIVDFGGGPIGSTPSWASFLAKLDANGGHAWSKPVSADLWGIQAMAALPWGALVIGGTAGAGFDAGCGPVAGGVESGYLATLYTDGACMAQRSLGSSLVQYVAGIAAGPSFQAAAIGYFQGEIDLGAGPIPAQNNDGFVMQIALPCAD